MDHTTLLWVIALLGTNLFTFILSRNKTNQANLNTLESNIKSSIDAKVGTLQASVDSAHTKLDTIVTTTKNLLTTK